MWLGATSLKGVQLARPTVQSQREDAQWVPRSRPWATSAMLDGVVIESATGSSGCKLLPVYRDNAWLSFRATVRALWLLEARLSEVTLTKLPPSPCRGVESRIWRIDIHLAVCCPSATTMHMAVELVSTACSWTRNASARIDVISDNPSASATQHGVRALHLAAVLVMQFGPRSPSTTAVSERLLPVAVRFWPITPQQEGAPWHGPGGRDDIYCPRRAVS